MPRKKKVPVNRKHLYPSIVENSSENILKESPPKIPRRDVTPKCVFKPNAKEQNYYLNKFAIGISNNILPEQWEKCNIQCYTEKLKLCFDKTIDAVISITDLVEINILKGFILAFFNDVT